MRDFSRQFNLAHQALTALGLGATVGLADTGLSTGALHTESHVLGPPEVLYKMRADRSRSLMVQLWKMGELWANIWFDGAPAAREKYLVLPTELDKSSGWMGGVWKLIGVGVSGLLPCHDLLLALVLHLDHEYGLEFLRVVEVPFENGTSATSPVIVLKCRDSLSMRMIVGDIFGRWPGSCVTAPVDLDGNTAVGLMIRNPEPEYVRMPQTLGVCFVDR